MTVTMLLICFNEANSMNLLPERIVIFYLVNHSPFLQLAQTTLYYKILDGSYEMPLTRTRQGKEKSGTFA